MSVPAPVRAAAGRRASALLAALTAACGGADSAVGPGAGSPAAPFGGQNCLVIVLDALHAGHLGCYGGQPDVSPAIDALATRGVRFSQARSNSAWTLPSTATLFTGLYPQTHGLDFGQELLDVRLAERADTLAELYAAAGYDTVYAGQNPFAGAAYGLDQGFADYEAYRIWTHDMIVALERRLARPHDRPTFTYVHLRRPHTPYDAAPKHRAPFVDPDYDGAVQGSDEDVALHNSGERRLEGADLEHVRALYLANVRQADAWVARLLAAVDVSRTLVVLTSDHGEAVGEHGTLGHNWHTWEEYVRIPLILVHPSLAPGTVLEAPVATVDLMPTLIELFGLPRPEQPLHGRSLAAALTGGADVPDRPVFVHGRRQGERRELSVVDGRWKYTRIEPAGEERLYDLVDDPGESTDLADVHPDRVARLREALILWRSPQRPAWTRASDGLDEETTRRLEQLGYVR
jgi:arylsulfatase A-like enzyme